MYNYPDLPDGLYSEIFGNNSSAVDSAAGAAVLAVLMGILLIAIAIGIVCYVFEAIGLYSIAKNRGIENPWLAWIPLANSWIYGKIGDYYTVKEGAPSKNLAVWVLCLTIGGIVFVWVPFVGFGASIAATVLEYICLYKFYKNISPNNAVLMIVMSIIFSIAMPFIIFANRNKPDVFQPVQPQYPQNGQPNYNYQPQQPMQQPAQPQANPYQQPVQQTPVQTQEPAQPVDNDTNNN